VDVDDLGLNPCGSEAALGLANPMLHRRSGRLDLNASAFGGALAFVGLCLVVAEMLGLHPADIDWGSVWPRWLAP
jgi:hypothetical protein